MGNVIVNADDFGKSHEVNLGIVEGFKRGMLTRTTLMMNMPFADEAVQMAKDHGFSDRIGLHLNLTEGDSLTLGIRNIPWLYRNGQMTDHIIPYLRSHWSISHREVLSIEAEMDAQFEKYKAYGLRLNHIDSHQHVHNEYLICKMICNMALNHGFKSMRIARNLMPLGGMRQKIKCVYKYGINRYIHFRFVSSDFFGSYEDYLKYYKGYGSVEIMLHPILRNSEIFDIVGEHLVPMDNYICNL